MAAAQGRLVAVDGGLVVVAAVTFQGALGQLFAAGAVGEAAGVVVVFEVGQLFDPGLAFQRQAGLVGGVVAAGDAAGAGFQSYAEPFDHRLVGNHAVALVEADRGEAGKYGLIVAKYQQVAVLAVTEVIVDALFLAQALDEVQVAFVVLGAVVAFGVVAAQLELKGVALDAVIFQHAADDLRYGQVLEDALVVAQGQVVQVRYQLQPVAGHALAGLADGGVVDQPVQAGAVAQVEPGVVLQQGFQIQIRLVADQLQFDTVALTDRLAGAEGQYLEVVIDARQGQGEVCCVGGGEHPLSSSRDNVKTTGRLPGQWWTIVTESRGNRCAPVVRTGSSGHFVGPDDLAVGEIHIFQVGEVRQGRILAVGHARLHVDDDGVFQLDGEVVLLGAGGGGAVPFQTALVQTLAGGQGVEQQGGGLVEDLGDHQRLVYALAGRLTGLRVAGNDDLMIESLNQDLVFMAFLEDVAHRVFGEGAGGDQALLGAFDGHVRGCWHGALLDG